MLASGGEATRFMIFFFIFAVIGLSYWSKHRQARFKLIERALNADHLDEATRKQLLESLSGTEWLPLARARLAALARNVARSTVLAFGWLRRFAVDQFSGQNKHRIEWLASGFRNVLSVSKEALFVVAWLGLFCGIAMLAVGIGFHEEEVGYAGVITVLVSFGVLTVPMARREAERRRA